MSAFQPNFEDSQHRFATYIADLPIDEIISSERETIDAAWAIPENRLQLAPSEEILTEVFCKLGSQYQKPKDTVRIARAMRPDEIDNEIKDFLKQVYELSPY